MAATPAVNAKTDVRANRVGAIAPDGATYRAQGIELRLTRVEYNKLGKPSTVRVRVEAA